MKQSSENIPSFKLNFPTLRVNNYGLEKLIYIKNTAPVIDVLAK